jgi:hypothetical protein
MTLTAGEAAEPALAEALDVGAMRSASRERSAA